MPVDSAEEVPALEPGALPASIVPRPRSATGLVKEDLDPLVAAAARGDQHAVAELMEVLRPVVARYVRARMGGRDLLYFSADDVTQEVLVAVFTALPDYQDQGGSFLYLVLAVAANKVADAYRAAARNRSESVSEVPEQTMGGNEPESYALRIELGSRLQEMLRWLAPLQQEIVTLRIVVGLSAEETAEVLGISSGNVRVTQHRALAKLREMVQEKGFGAA